MTAPESQSCFLEEFQVAPWGLQQTFRTPLQNLQPFVRTILRARDQVERGCLIIDKIIFEPKHLAVVAANRSLRGALTHGSSLTFAAKREAETILEAAFADWIDFLFVPAPALFVIYADHDEYATFYARTRSDLELVVQALCASSFERVPGYERRFS